jgi:hypothetical protein
MIWAILLGVVVGANLGVILVPVGRRRDVHAPPVTSRKSPPGL